MATDHVLDEKKTKKLSFTLHLAILLSEDFR